MLVPGDGHTATRMTLDVIQRIRRAYDAFNRHDMDAALEAMHPDVEWPNVMEGEMIRGREAVREYWSRQWSIVRSTVEPVEIVPCGERIAVRVRQTVRVLETGEEDVREVAHVYTMRDGATARMEVLYDFDEARRAIGVRSRGDERRARLRAASLYLVCDARPGGRELEPFLDAALRGGVDIVQLRDKDLEDDALLTAARCFCRASEEHDALFILNDRPELVAACEADGVHVGQDDVAVPEARALVGEDRLVGLSTHSRAQVDAARGVDYIAVGPVHETPTKPGRPAVGLDPVRHAAVHASVPWFAIGGLDELTISEAIGAGARRAVVVRAVADARDPEAAARALRAALDAHPLDAEAPVGAT